MDFFCSQFLTISHFVSGFQRSSWSLKSPLEASDFSYLGEAAAFEMIFVSSNLFLGRVSFEMSNKLQSHLCTIKTLGLFKLLHSKAGNLLTNNLDSCEETYMLLVTLLKIHIICQRCLYFKKA